MAAINRTAMTDDDGTGTTGTIINNAWKTQLYDQIDQLISALLSGNETVSGAWTFSGTIELTGTTNFRGTNSFIGPPSTYARARLLANGGASGVDIVFFQKEVAGDFKIIQNNGAVDALALDLSGNMRLPQYGAGTLVTDSSGNVTASSDARLKDVLGPFEAGLPAVMGLRPVLHRWKPETRFDSDNTYAAFVAQNVMEFIPEAVGVAPDGYLTVNVNTVTLAIVNAVQSLVDELDSVRKHVKLPQKTRTMAPVDGTARAIKSVRAVAAAVDDSTSLKKRGER